MDFTKMHCHRRRDFYVRNKSIQNHVSSRTILAIASIITALFISSSTAQDQSTTPSPPTSISDEQTYISRFLGLVIARLSSAPNDEEYFCTLHFNEDVQTERRPDESFKKVTFYSEKGSGAFCKNSNQTINPPLEPSHLAILQRNMAYSIDPNCSLDNWAKRQTSAVSHNSGLLINISSDIDLSSQRMVNNPPNNNTIALINTRTADRLKEMDSIAKGNNSYLEVLVVTPLSGTFDFSLVVIGLMAVFCLVVGSYWSGLERLRLYIQEMNENLQSGEGRRQAASSKAKLPEEMSTLNVTPKFILILVAFMSLMLVVMYFLIQYLIYAVVFLFTIATMVSTYACLLPVLIFLLPAKWAEFRLSMAYGHVDPTTGLRQDHSFRPSRLVLVAFSMGLSIAWFVHRRSLWAWFLQDSLGIMFCINMLRNIRLPSFKIITMLLVMLFIYDIFFVFVTPYLTPDGRSIMVVVATGGSGTGAGGSVGGGSRGEDMPMVLKVPHITFMDKLNQAFESCLRASYSVLGYGDILFPGLLVSYCYGWDLVTQDINSRLGTSSARRNLSIPLYFVLSSISFTVGMLVTFAALFLMKGVAQPALLYLVPCTVIPPLIAALWRGEIDGFWYGRIPMVDGTSSSNGDHHIEEGLQPPSTPQTVSSNASPSQSNQTQQDQPKNADPDNTSGRLLADS